jgi:hypothetical protein
VNASTPADNLSSGTNLPDRKRHWLTGTTAASLAQLFLLLLAGVVRRHALNPDGVAYLRIAGYYLHGQTDLAVSGYWGPLLSWFMTPLLALGFSPLPAARVVMALTAVFFLRSCLSVFRAFELPQSLLRLGAWLAVAVSVCWSVENITPDLLAAGLIGYAVSFMVRPRWHEQLSSALWVGILWGLAFLAKAAAFPLALIVTAGMTVVWWRGGGRDGKKIGCAALATLLGFAIVAGPWVAVISAKYHHFTVSRSAQLNHAMAGPSDVARFYPLDRGLQAPEAGRVTFWEDPDLPYPDWSPLASVANAQRQLRIILRNTPRVVFIGQPADFRAALFLCGVSFPLCFVRRNFFGLAAGGSRAASTALHGLRRRAFLPPANARAAYGLAPAWINGRRLRVDACEKTIGAEHHRAGGQRRANAWRSRGNVRRLPSGRAVVR